MATNRSRMQKHTPLRAALGAARQALLASPTRGEVNSTRWRHTAKPTALTLPLEGRVAKLGPKILSVAGEGVLGLPNALMLGTVP
jgi:hypothetical protein